MRYCFTFLTILFFLITPVFVLAQGVPSYTPIVGVPGLEKSPNLTTQQYVNALYRLSITVGALLAVVQIIVAGVQYMFSDVVTSKSAAIKKIRGALFGLIIILGAVLLLQTINPNLLNLNIFNNAPSINTIKGTGNTQTTVPASKIGARVLSSNSAAVAAMKQTCPGTVGTIASGKVMQVGCFASASSVNAQVGDTFDGNQYAPAERSAANAKFASSCETNGGTYEDNFGPDRCISQVAFAPVTLGSSINLVGKSAAEQAKLRLHYAQNCTGTITETNSRGGGTTLNCR